MKNETRNNLDRMKQYPIERELFCDIFSKVYNEFYVEFYNITTQSFKCWYDDDEFYVLHLDSGTLINWYKHLGRCLTCNKNLSIDEYKYLANLLYEEIKENNYDKRWNK